MRMDDLLPVAAWKKFEQELNQATGLNACVFDAEGNRVTDFVAWANGLCPLIKSDPASAQAICSVAHQEIARQARQTRQPAVAECDAGMLKICVPIYVDETFVGIAGGCGMLADPAHLEPFHVSRVTDLPEERVVELAGDIPILTTDKAAATAALISDRVAEVIQDVTGTARQG